MNETIPGKSIPNIRIRIGLIIIMLGLVIFALGVQPALFGLDRSPVVGFVQITVFLFGLAIICIGGYLVLNTLWNGRQKTIPADIGFRLITTGYVIAAVSGMADVFGFGSQPFPNVPYFGPWQASGVMFGQVMITIGFLMLIPYNRREDQSQAS
jgi:hypothetical protein